MKIKSEPQDSDRRETSDAAAKKSPKKKKKKSDVLMLGTAVRVKTETVDRPVKQESTDRKCSPLKSVKKEPVDRAADLTTHVVKSEVKLENGAEASTSSTKTRTSKKKKVTRRKTTKRKTTKKKKTGRKKMRKTKVLRSSRGVGSNVRARIAAKIGLVKRKTLGPHSLPLINKPSYELPPARSDLIPSLSLLGHGLPLYGAVTVMDEFEDNSDFSAETAVATRRSHFTSTRLCDLKAGLIPDPLEEIRLNSDLLGSILETQEVLLSRSKDVAISTDGTLKLNSCLPIRKHTSTNDASDGKACNSPPASDPNSHENGSQEINQHIDLDANNHVSNSSIPSGKEQENISTIRTSVPCCGMPLKKRKFEPQGMGESSEAKLRPDEKANSVDPKSEPTPVSQDLVKSEPEQQQACLTAKIESNKGALESVQSDTTVAPPANQCLDDEPSIGTKLEPEKNGKEEPPSSRKESGRAEERKVKRCRHGKIVKDKSSKDTKSDNRQDLSRREEVGPETRHDSGELISKSNGAEEAKRRIVVRSEVRDKKLSEKIRSEDREKSHSHRIHKKTKEEVWIESSDRRSRYCRDEVDRERDRSRSGRRARSREQSPAARRTSRHEEEKPIRKTDHSKFQRHCNEMEHDKGGKHRHHHRMNPDRQHKEEGKAVKDSISERNPRVDSNLAPEAKAIHNKSKAYDKPVGDSARHASKDSRSQTTRRMSGPKTPPDVRMKSLSASNNKSPPTPTMDETDSPASAAVSLNGSLQHQQVNRRPVSSRTGGKDTKDLPLSDPPLFASPTKVANPSSWLKQFSRPDIASRPSSSHPSLPSSQAEAEKELDSGTNQIAIQQFLQSMLPKSKSVESPESETAYSPGGPLIASPVRDEPSSGTSSLPSSANQSIIDQILKFAQQAQQNTSTICKSDANLEERQKARASVRKLVSGDGPASAEDVHLKEKVSCIAVNNFPFFR